MKSKSIRRKIAIVAGIFSPSLACPGTASAHVEAIVYTVLGVFVAYQFALAIVLLEAKGLERRRLLALSGYGLALGVVWKFVILNPLEFQSAVLYFLFSLGIPAVTAVGIYWSLRRDAGKVQSRGEVLSAVLSAAATERLAEFSDKSFDELSALPDYSGQEVLREGYKLMVPIWHDVLESGEHRIVAQAGKPGILASWRFHAEGFAINSLNERRALTNEELSSFQ